MDATVLIVPGLRDHVAEHWQTLLAAELPRVRTVEPLEHDRLSRAARVERLDRTLAEIDGPVVLVAHSAGVMMVAHWAQAHRRPIRGVLLAAPADVETPFPAGYPTVDELRAHGWLPIPRNPLPFPAILAASSNDPLARLDRAADLARDWHAEFVDIGPAGHLNPAAGYGPWPQAKAFVSLLDKGLIAAEA